MKRISAINPVIVESMENSLIKRVPHISIYESHNILIELVLNPQFILI